MLLTKLHTPSPVKNLVQRSGLFDKLNEGFCRKLILVSAPAGFGKTTLISDWINKYKVPTSWFSLDKSDNDPVEFLSYIIVGIQSIRVSFGQSALKLLHSPNKPANESVISLLINEMLKINQEFLLVLDDFHLIDSSEISELVNYLLGHIPENIHIAIITRSDPALSLARLRSQHQLVELRSSDLSFSAYDISVLFNKNLKINLSIDDANSLETKTEGWIAGLQLTALSIQDREDISKFILDLNGDNRYIMDYLIEEVLKIQSDEIKEFLLQTSILEKFSAPLCNTILNRNDSQVIIEKIEKHNLFVVPLDSERKWYRYHHLFADLLKQRLLFESKPDIEKLHIKALLWFEQNNMHELAIEHALEISDYEKSIQILGKIVEDMWESGLHTAILRYGELIPDELIKKNPDFCLYFSWILITTGQIEKAEPFLVSAEKITKKIIKEEHFSNEIIHINEKLLGKTSAALAYLNTFKGPSEKVLDYTQIAMKYLSKEDSLWLGWVWYFVGIAEMTTENLKQGTIAFQKSLENSRKSNNLYLISTITATIAFHEMSLGHYKASYKQCSDFLAFMKVKGYSQFAKTEWTYSGLFSLMSVAQSIWTDFDAALESVKTAYDLCRNEKDITQKIMALLAYSYVLYAREDRTGAINRLVELEGVMKQYKISPYLVSTYVGWKIRIFIDLNQIDEANDFVKSCGLGLNKKISYSDEHSYIFYVRLLLAQNKFDEADAMLSELYTLAYSGKRIETLVQLKILSALLYKMKGNQEKAVRSLIEAMEFAADENLLVYFLFDLNLTNDILNEAYKIQATTKNKISKQFIDKLKLAIVKKENRARINANFELSIRELDFLKLIAENLTNPEIAEKLFVSVNTVKTHLKNIYLKLDVDSRAKAVTKAKQLQLI